MIGVTVPNPTLATRLRRAWRIFTFAVPSDAATAAVTHP